MSEGRTKIGHKTEAVIAALLAEPTLAKAAEKSGIGEATLSRWLRRPGFQRRYRLARRQIVEGVIGRLQAGCTDALETLNRSLHCGVPSVELRAALGFLGLALKGIELCDLMGVADRLEKWQKAEEQEKKLNGGFYG